ncbi:MAG TPA: undecaprenyl-diphosphate phosphatase [bacterium]|nr:undecaprenyl-diphosphate phosphatase [bacterium]
MESAIYLFFSILLGILQGLTEFLPISSSGHLALIKHLLSLDLESVPLFLDTILHLGTLVAVFIVFADDLLAIAREGWQTVRERNWREAWRERPHVRLIVWIAVATIPAVIVGFTLVDVFDRAFTNVRMIGVALLITAALLLASRWAPPAKVDMRGLGWGRSLIVGLVQAAAITPGISRSGSTIVAGMMTGLERETAARLSFLISIPAILGAVLLQALRIKEIPDGFVVAAIGGFIASVVSGYFALKVLLRFVRRGSLYWFGFYCMILGIIAIVGS